MRKENARSPAMIETIVGFWLYRRDTPSREIFSLTGVSSVLEN